MAGAVGSPSSGTPGTTGGAATPPTKEVPDTVDVTADQLFANPQMQELFALSLISSLNGINAMSMDVIKQALDDS